MMEKIKIGDIKEDLQINKITKERHKNIELEWPHYDSSLFKIGNSFYKTLPKEYLDNYDEKSFSSVEDRGLLFKKYIESTLLKNKNISRTAIEFGGPGSKLFQGFTKGFFKRTVGICLDDVRPAYKRNEDDINGHDIIVGDIMDVNNKNLFDKINNTLKTDKVDLIISRMQGPLNKIRKNPVLLDRIIRKWYGLLNKNGMLFAQFEYFPEHDPNIEKIQDAKYFPPSREASEDNVEQWITFVKQKFQDQIEIQLGRGVIRMLKKDNAPDELPSAKELFN